MKVLYISSMRDFFSGAKKQLKWEKESASELGIDWNIVVIHDGIIEDSLIEINPPIFFRNILLRNLFTWIYIIKEQKNYDVIINRHITFDPFVIIFGWFIKNRFSVHHGKEIEGLKVVRSNWKGKLASFIEQITGYISLKQVKGAICVTQDIAKYQKKRANVKTFLFPNAINIKTIDLLNDRRINDEINIAFVCSVFSAWHGLDLLLENYKNNINFIRKNNIKIHLIGTILEKDLEIINTINDQEHIKIYGHLSHNEYNKILEKCDIGLDSLALYREGLEEGAALKVREYLAYGLAIYSAYKDTAIPINFDYYKIGKIDIKEIYNYSIKMKNISREEIRFSSVNYISKELLLKKLYVEIKDFK